MTNESGETFSNSSRQRTGDWRNLLRVSSITYPTRSTNKPSETHSSQSGKICKNSCDTLSLKSNIRDLDEEPRLPNESMHQTISSPPSSILDANPENISSDHTLWNGSPPPRNQNWSLNNHTISRRWQSLLKPSRPKEKIITTTAIIVKEAEEVEEVTNQEAEEIVEEGEIIMQEIPTIQTILQTHHQQTRKLDVESSTIPYTTGGIDSIRELKTAREAMEQALPKQLGEQSGSGRIETELENNPATNEETSYTPISGGQRNYKETYGTMVERGDCFFTAPEELGDSLLLKSLCSSPIQQIKALSRSKGVERQHSLSTFQDGVNTHAKNIHYERGQHDQGGLKGRIPSPEPSPRREEIFRIRMGGGVLPVERSSIWSLLSAKDIHKINQNSDGNLASERDQISILPGRYHSNGEEKGMSGSWDTNERSSNKIRLGPEHENREDKFNTSESDKLPRIQNRLSPNEDKPTSRQTQESAERPGNDDEKADGTQASIHDWQTERMQYSDMADPYQTEEPTSRPHQSPEISIVGRCNDAVKQGEGGFALVEEKHKTVERTGYDTSISRSQTNDINRCVKNRLGSPLGEFSNSGTLLSVGESTIIELSRTKDSSHRHTATEVNLELQDSLGTDGQYHNSLIHKQNGRDEIPLGARACYTNLGGSITISDKDTGRIPARDNEHGSRPAIQAENRQGKLATESPSIQGNRANDGSTDDRPHGGPGEYTDKRILQLHARPLGEGNRLLSADLAGEGRIRKSTLQSSKQDITKNQNRATGRDSISNTTVANAELVRRYTENVDLRTHDLRTINKTITPSIRRVIESGKTANLANSRVETIRSSLQEQGYDQTTISILSSDARSATTKSKNSNWKAFANWCEGEGINPWERNVTNGLAYLSSEIKNGAKPDLVKARRSAISTTWAKTHPKEPAFGTMPVVTEYIRKISDLAATPSIVPVAWDVGTVLDHIKSWGDTDSLSYPLLTKKTAALLTLASLWRPASDIKRILISHIQFEVDDQDNIAHGSYRTWPDGTWPNRVTITAFKCKETLEKSRSIPRFEEDKQICPVYTLLIYMKQMTIKRKMPLHAESTLLVSTVPPHAEVKEETISGWFKSILQAVGIDARVHQVRGVTSSINLFMKIPMNTICKGANWSIRSQTFKKHYFHQVKEALDTDQLSKNVLKQCRTAK
jgi:hypothetical protein